MYDDCQVCGVVDHGFNKPDCRATLYFPEDHEYETCKVTISINRKWKRCTYCGSQSDFDVEFIVNGPDQTFTVPTESIAWDTVEAVWPDATGGDYEDERWLRYQDTVRY